MIRLVFCSSYKALLLVIPAMLVVGYVGAMAQLQVSVAMYAAAILMGIMLGVRAVIETFRKQPKKSTSETSRETKPLRPDQYRSLNADRYSEKSMSN
jgi:hypothetical protein